MAPTHHFSYRYPLFFQWQNKKKVFGFHKITYYLKYSIYKHYRSEIRLQMLESTKCHSVNKGQHFHYSCLFQHEFPLDNLQEMAGKITKSLEKLLQMPSGLHRWACTVRHIHLLSLCHHLLKISKQVKKQKQ